MLLSPTIQPPPEDCTELDLPASVLAASMRFTDASNEYRLDPELRRAAQTKDPYEILARAGEAFYRAQQASTPEDGASDMELGNALADLAVTGRASYTAFQAQPLTPAVEQDLSNALSRRLVQVGIAASEAQRTAALAPALDRAFAVAWALRGPAAQRLDLRTPIGWIAVSGEDDKPHRPVNVESAPWEQYDVALSAGGLSLRTRFFIASAQDTAPANVPSSLRTLPPDPVPYIPDEHRVILFLHGHSSGAEEAMTIIPHIHAAGLAQGVKYSVISLDLPNNGYGETFDHTTVARSDETKYPGGINDHGPVVTPILAFIEDFIISFVNTVDSPLCPIKERFAGIIGGSLGGNLGLRLGRRDLTNDRWLETGIVSWDAASVWAPMVQDELKRIGPDHCRDSSQVPESSMSRHDYFYESYDKVPLPGTLPPQPEMWYRDDWNCKPVHIKGSRIARREIYNADFRQWHWRVAGEQLVFSHFDHTDHEDARTPRWYELNTARQMLVAGEQDNYKFANIYRATQHLAQAMGRTPGHSLFIADTGHSIHFERPIFFAGQIVRFLSTSAMLVSCIHRENGRIVRVGGIDVTRGVAFRMSHNECIDAIRAGNDFFCIGSDGSRTDVLIETNHGPGSTSTGVFITTRRDYSQKDNLLSLPEC